MIRCFHGLHLPGDKSRQAVSVRPSPSECGRMTQPYMIDAFSSNGLTHCPSYRLSAVRPELKRCRDLPGDYVIQNLIQVSWEKGNKSTSMVCEQECLNNTTRCLIAGREARLILHPEICLLIMALCISQVLHFTDEWIRCKWEGKVSAAWRDYTQS